MCLDSLFQPDQTCACTIFSIYYKVKLLPPSFDVIHFVPRDKLQRRLQLLIHRIPRSRRFPPSRVRILPRLYEPLLTSPRRPCPPSVVALLLRRPHRPQRGRPREAEHAPDEQIPRQRRREGPRSHPAPGPPGRCGGGRPPVAEVTYARLAGLEIVHPPLLLIPEDGVGLGYSLELLDTVGRSLRSGDVGVGLHAYCGHESIDDVVSMQQH